MAASAKLPDETLSARHIPLAHGQSVSFHLYSSAQVPRSPSSISLNASIVSPQVGCSFQSHSRNSSFNNEPEITEQVTEESSPTSQINPFQSRDSPQNILFPECDNDSDGNKVYNYCKGFSSEPNRNSNVTQNRALGNTAKSWLPYSFQCSDRSSVRNHIAKNMHQGEHLYGNSKDHDQIKSLSDSGLQHLRDYKSTSMDIEEQEYEDEEDCNENVPKAFSDCEFPIQNQTDNDSSSFNSSEGVLVNFSVIYSTDSNAVFSMKDNLDYHAKQSHRSGSMSQDDAVKSILSWTPCGVDPNCNVYPLDTDSLTLEFPDSTARLQSPDHLMTSAQNYYTVVTCDLSTQPSLSPARSSVNSCSDVYSHGSLTPPAEHYLFKQPEEAEGQVLDVNQKDLQGDGITEMKRDQRDIKNLSKGAREKKSHKTCHLNSKSPDLTSHENTSTTQPQSKGWQNSPNQEANVHVPNHPVQTDINLSSYEPICPSQTGTVLSSHDSKQDVTSFVEIGLCNRGDRDSPLVKNSIQNTKIASCSERKVELEQNVTNHTAKMSQNPGTSEVYNIQTILEGACVSTPEVVRYTKAQRPTSLPIQPFILQPPSGEQHSTDLGSLLSQYISHFHGKTRTSKNMGKCEELASHPRAWPLGPYTSIHLESSSDTCSTCSPSPVQCHRPSLWVQPSTLLTHTHPESDQQTLKPKPPEKNPVQTCLDQSHPTPKQCCADQQEAFVKHFPTTDSLQISLPVQVPSQIPHSLLEEELTTTRPSSTEECGVSLHSLSPAIPSQTSLTSDTCLISASGAGRKPPWALISLFHAGPVGCLLKAMKWQGDSFCRTERAPAASREPLSIHQLCKTNLLKPVSLAVELITAHFSSCTDLEEKIRLGNSSLCPNISKLVLSQLCPAIQNILQDGLRAFKCDLIVGQRHNTPWSVVEASAQLGPSTRILNSLVSVVRKCSQLPSHSTRLNAFFFSLLNLRALEEWFLQLHTCASVVAEYYHPWAFLTLSQGPAWGSLFQEFLVLLQPLSQLPFDLHLLSELQRRPERRERSTSRPLPLLACPFLQIFSSQRRPSSPESLKQMEENVHTESHTACSTHTVKVLRACMDRSCKLPKLLSPGERQTTVSPVCSRRERAGWWLAETGICSNSPPCAGGVELKVENGERRTVGISTMSPGNKPNKELHWAWIFGSGISTPVAMNNTAKRSKATQRRRLPSQWLKLGTSKV